MSTNVYGIDLGTCNLKIFCKSTGKVINEKNTIAIVNKNQLYAFGNDAYAMYEKAPDSIQVSFPVVNGVIADYNNMQNRGGKKGILRSLLQESFQTQKCLAL